MMREKGKGEEGKRKGWEWRGGKKRRGEER